MVTPSRPPQNPWIFVRKSSKKKAFLAIERPFGEKST
jgi:hypothetical protein